MHHINILSIIIPSKIIPILESDLGETFEFKDRLFKIFAVGEKVSYNPDIYAIYIEGSESKVQHVIKREVTYDHDLMCITMHHKFKCTFKKSGEEFECIQPPLVTKVNESSIISSEYIGVEIIKHKTSAARVEIAYAKSKNEQRDYCFEGKIYDINDKLHGILEGSCLKILMLTDAETSKTEELWGYDNDDECFNSGYHFVKFFTETFNDIDAIKCQTDSRHKIQAESLKKSEVKDASNDLEQEICLTKFTYVKDYEPKWFKLIKCDNPQEVWYEYTHKYWHTKMSTKF